MARVAENDVAEAVRQYLSGLPSRSATIHQIKRALPNHLHLSAEDRQPSQTRNGEELWEQQVRNIVSHRDTPGNYVHDGILVYTPGKLSLP